MLLAMLDRIDLRREEGARIWKITLTKARAQPRPTSLAGLPARADPLPDNCFAEES